MPYVGITKTERLTLPSNSSYWVDMKVKCTYGDRLAAQNAMLRISNVDLASVPAEKAAMVEADVESGRGILTEIELEAFFSTLLVRLIIAWNLDDEDGHLLPITIENIGRLEDEDGSMLMTEARAKLRKRPVETERPFDGPSKPLSLEDRRHSQKRSGR